MVSQLFYSDFDTIKELYPEIYESGDAVITKNADGTKSEEKRYVIPDFVLNDDFGFKLHIKNLYCVFSGAAMHFDILLPGNVFYNTKVVIAPIHDESDGSPKRVIYIDTFEDGRNELFMQEYKVRENVIGYYSLLRDFVKD